MKYKPIVLFMLIVLTVSLAACDSKNSNAANNTADFSVGSEFGEPPMSVSYKNLDQFAQAIKDKTIFAETNGEITEESVFAKAPVIKLEINGKEPDYYVENVNEDYQSKSKVTVYYREHKEYFCRYQYEGYERWIFFEAIYLADDTSEETFPEREDANYTAVINGEEVRIKYQADEGQHWGFFQYKNLYKVKIMTYNQELFDTVFGNLTIKEVSVK